MPRVQHVIRQAKQRVFGGNTHVAQKLVSIFEPTTEIIRKGKASKPTEFGKMLKIQEAENQIITDYAVYEKRPSDSDLVLSTKSAERKRQQKKRWFRNGQKWRTGCEGRISLLKRRHGLNRCRYKGDEGMKRWVGLGVIADNLINIGRFLATHPTG